MIHLTASELTPNGSSTVHIYTQTIHRIQRTEHTIKKLGTYITIKKFKTNLGSAGHAPSLMSYTLAFALQLRKKQGKTSVRVAACTSQADTV
jgi:hypothetical protein